MPKPNSPWPYRSATKSCRPTRNVSRHLWSSAGASSALNRYTEVISTGQAGMRVAFDARISEVMGESYYFLGQMENCLKSLQKYVEVSGDSGDRGPTAYFFMGEAYLRLKKYSHADMAYSTAVLKEPSMPRWWFRLGNACEASGDWKRALDAYNKALALSPALPEAVSAQARVKAQAAP